MSTPHKHAELIKAWSDGAEVQVFCESDGEWRTTDCPSWISDKYRLKPHKWQHCIDAQKAGKVVQGRIVGRGGPWVGPIFGFGWPIAAFAEPSYEFRIKPETIRYRVALCVGGSGLRFTQSVDTDDQAAVVSRCHGFTEWLTDWVEKEL